MHYTAITVVNQLRITQNPASNVSRSTEVCQDSYAHDHHTPHDSEPHRMLTVPRSQWGRREEGSGGTGLANASRRTGLEEEWGDWAGQLDHICEVINLFFSPVLEDGVINFLPAQIRPSVLLILRH